MKKKRVRPSVRELTALKRLVEDLQDTIGKQSQKLFDAQQARKMLERELKLVSTQRDEQVVQFKQEFYRRTLLGRLAGAAVKCVDPHQAKIPADAVDYLVKGMLEELKVLNPPLLGSLWQDATEAKR